jgi:NADH-quinone oxidoreductase subunit C/D
MRIIEQVMENLPAGPIMAAEPKITLPPKENVYQSIEGLIHHFKIIVEGIQPPRGEVYSYTEAGSGELGYYIVSDGSAHPYRIKVRPPCYAIYQAYGEMIKGHMMADAVAILSSMNIVAGELDR